MKAQKDERDLGLRIGVILRRYREHRDMTQAALAKAAEVSQGEVSYIEAGKRSHLRTLDRVAGALGMPLSEVIRRAEDIGSRKDVLKQVRGMIARLDAKEGTKATAKRRKAV